MKFSICDSIDKHPKDAVLFFKVMMRLEYSLKEKGFVCPTQHGFRIDWDRFSNELLGQNFFERVAALPETKTLLQSPPSRQILKGGKLSFSPAAPPTIVQSLFGAIRKTRNNMFHGGKSGDPDHDRNDALIAGALEVVRLALEADNELRFAFEGQY